MKIDERATINRSLFKLFGRFAHLVTDGHQLNSNPTQCSPKQSIKSSTGLTSNTLPQPEPKRIYHLKIVSITSLAKFAGIDKLKYEEHHAAITLGQRP